MRQAATAADAAIRAHLDRPELRRLWQLTAARLGQLGRVGGRVTLPAPSVEERGAIADLLAWRTEPSGDLSIPLDRLDQKLRDCRLHTDLCSVVTTLCGPLSDPKAERAAQQATFERAIETAMRHHAMTPRLRAWLERDADSGMLKRIAGADPTALLAQVTEALGCLPLAPPRLLPEAAARLANHTHALDSGSPLATLLLRAIASQHDRPIPTSAVARRSLWECVGVICDDLSCDVLVLNLRPKGKGEGGGEELTARLLRQAGVDGEPLRLTLRQVRGLSEPFDAGPFEPGTLFVTENPAILSAASRQLGGRCPAMLCSSGFPTTAALELIGGHAASGAAVYYHGDFDWAGIRIAATVWKSTPFSPWRFDAASYLEVVGVSPVLLSGPAVDTPWDDGLRRVMQERGIAVHEEMVIDGLLDDLGAG